MSKVPKKAFIFVGTIKMFNYSFIKMVDWTKLYDSWLVKCGRNIYVDYKHFPSKLKRKCLNHPIKTLKILTTGTVGWFLAKNNPNEVHFKDSFIRARNATIVNENDEAKKDLSFREHLRYVEKCYNSDTIRRLNLLFFSVMWVDKHKNENNNYMLNSVTNVAELFKSVTHFGILNNWWLVTKK